MASETQTLKQNGQCRSSPILFSHIWVLALAPAINDECCQTSMVSVTASVMMISDSIAMIVRVAVFALSLSPSITAGTAVEVAAGATPQHLLAFTVLPRHGCPGYTENGYRNHYPGPMRQ